MGIGWRDARLQGRRVGWRIAWGWRFGISWRVSWGFGHGCGRRIGWRFRCRCRRRIGWRIGWNIGWRVGWRVSCQRSKPINIQVVDLGVAATNRINRQLAVADRHADCVGLMQTGRAVGGIGRWHKLVDCHNAFNRYIVRHCSPTSLSIAHSDGYIVNPIWNCCFPLAAASGQLHVHQGIQARIAVDVTPSWIADQALGLASAIDPTIAQT